MAVYFLRLFHTTAAVYYVLRKILDIIYLQTENTYRTAMSPTIDLLQNDDFNAGRSEAEFNI